jgi:hypothetical protein
MANPTVPPYPQLQIQSDNPSYVTEWIQGFRILMRAGEIINPTRQRALLLHYLGPAGRREIDTVPDTGTIDEIEPLIAALNTRLVPVPNLTYERHMFRDATHQAGESTDRYQARLHHLAASCEFPQRDAEICSHIITTTRSDNLRRRALREHITLTDLLTLARSMEKADMRAATIAQGPSSADSTRHHSEGIHPLTSRRKQPQNITYQPRHRTANNSDGTCFYCGRKHVDDPKQCPAQGKTCHSCGRLHHLANVCRSKPPPTSSAPRQQFSGPATSATRATNQARKPISFAQIDNNLPPQPLPLNVDAINDNATSFPEADISVHGKTFKFLIDTGASANIIDQRDMAQLLPHIRLHPSDVNIHAYKSQMPLQTMGQFQAQIACTNRDGAYHSTLATILVVKQTGRHCRPLLSFNTAKRLHLIRMMNNINTTNTLDQLIQSNSHLFQGLGRMKDTQIRLHIDESVTPVKQSYRRIPFHLRAKVEKQLQSMLDDDIIEPVTVAKSWISPVVIVAKRNSDDVRICIDMRCANKAVQRERHIMPTMDDIIQDLDGSTMFSKLDLNQGYHQLDLHPDSRHITTFTTHKGLFRYKRLNFGISSASEIFQNAIANAISGIQGAKNISDDILIHARTPQDHHDILQKVLQRLTERGLTLNQAKCEFRKDSIIFYGHKFSAAGISPDPSKVTAVHDTPPLQPSASTLSPRDHSIFLKISTRPRYYDSTAQKSHHETHSVEMDLATRPSSRIRKTCSYQ